VVGNQEEERKSVYVQCRKYLKGILIFIVVDIWNCYNMGMKKATNRNWGVTHNETYY